LPVIKGRNLRWFLALTFVVGQWLGVVHGTQHELSSADRLVACEVCAVGHAAAPPPAMLAIPLASLRSVEITAPLQSSAPRQILLLRPPSRGPPSHFA